MYELLEELRQWAIECNVSVRALRSLLSILRNRLGIDGERMPKDPRTLMGTAVNVEIDELEEGAQYWHQGVETCLRNVFANLSEDLAIVVNINIDGLPLFSSATKCFWPILMNITGRPDIVAMVIGIFYGEKKPENICIYLRKFVNELKSILANGLIINGYHLTIKMRCFICDTPARAFIKGTKNFNAMHGCQRCTVIGKHSNISRTVVFKSSEPAPLRTDAVFRIKGYPEHQKVLTPLVELPGFDTIKDVIVADPLHLLDLGICKRFLIGFQTGNLDNQMLKWSHSELVQMSEHLISMRTPAEINRSARSLMIFRFWKGQEFRNFLLYFGFITIRGHLPSANYFHFMKLFCAVRLASSEKYVENIVLIDKLFRDYVREFRTLYGSQFMTSNVHNLLHIAEDVKRFGILSSISAYPFESCLGRMKRMIRAGPNPLQQIARRILERGNTLSSKNVPGAAAGNTMKPYVIRKDDSKFVTVHIPDRSFMITNKRFEDQWILANDKILQMIDANTDAEDVYLQCFALLSKENAFDNPLPSSRINVYEGDTTAMTDKMEMVNATDIECKFFVAKSGHGAADTNQYVFVPVLHTEK